MGELVQPFILLTILAILSVWKCTHPLLNLSKTKVMYQDLKYSDLKEYLDDTDLKIVLCW